MGESVQQVLEAGVNMYIEWTGGAGSQPDWDTVMIRFDTGESISVQEIFNGLWQTDGASWIQGTFSASTDFIGLKIYSWFYQDSTTSKRVSPNISTFDLENIDQMRSEILAFNSTTAPFILNDLTTELPPYQWVYEAPNNVPNLLCSQEGLGLKCYNSDLFNNWLKTEYVNSITLSSSVSTIGDSFTIDQLNIAKKIYDLLNRISVSGGSYNDWIDATYSEKSRRRAESPVFMGGLQRQIVFQEVVSNSEAGNQPLATLAGRGIMSNQRIGGRVTISADEPSYIMGIVSITPNIDYSQGNTFDMWFDTMDDLHKPALDQIGFQDLITEQMAWWDCKYNAGTTTWEQKSAGKQPSWINYMTSINKTYGNFAIDSNQMFMTLNRRYEFDGTNDTIADLTTYIDPGKYNFIFAESSIDAMNFWVQIGLKITAKRKMSAKIMPML